MHDLIFFLKLFAPHRVRLTGGICLSLAASLAGIGLLALSGWFITASALAGLWSADGAALTFNFLVPAAQIRALAIIRTLARYAERLVTHEATFRALSEIRLWFFRKLIPLTPGRLSLLRSGDLLSRLTADIDALDGLYLRLLLPTLVAFVGGFTIILLLYRYSPPIAGITLIALTAASIVIPWYFERLGRSGAERTVVLASEYRSAVIELLQGMADLLAYRAFERYRSQTLAISDRLIEVQRSNNGLAALSSALTLLLSQTAVLAVLLLGNTALEQKRLSGADLAMIVFCVLAAFELTAPLPKAFQMLGRLNKAAGRIRSVAELPPTIAEPEQSLPLPKHFDLTVERVSFRYPDRNDRVLNDIDLAIP
ncbi:MAG: amino acid ABC transporter ATP-binding/permease protein, partial [Gammaproteobacteria bacterium]